MEPVVWQVHVARLGRGVEVVEHHFDTLGQPAGGSSRHLALPTMSSLQVATPVRNDDVPAGTSLSSAVAGPG